MSSKLRNMQQPLTGDHRLERALFTNDDVKLYVYKRAMIITSIDPGALRSDVADRLNAGRSGVVGRLAARRERIEHAHDPDDAGTPWAGCLILSPGLCS